MLQCICLRETSKARDEYLKAAKGVLVIPGVTKVAFIIGGKYGQGSLRIEDKTAGYYSLASGSQVIR